MAKRRSRKITCTIDESNVLTISNIEVYPRLSDETLAMSADVELNGKRIGYVENNGKGEGNYPRVDKPYWEEYRKCEEAVKRHHYHSAATPDYPHTCDWDYDMDFLIGMMVEAAAYEGKKEYKL